MEGYFYFFGSSKVKCWMKLWFVMCASVALTACTVGNGRICGPQTPIAYCDKEAYQELAHPKPYLQYWEKEGMTAESRRQDSVRCGAADTDHILGFGQNKIKAAQRPGETNNETDTRLLHDWQRCMIKQGYRFTGKCYDNEISRASPACAGRVLQPLKP